VEDIEDTVFDASQVPNYEMKKAMASDLDRMLAEHGGEMDAGDLLSVTEADSTDNTNGASSVHHRCVRSDSSRHVGSLVSTGTEEMSSSNTGVILQQQQQPPGKQDH